MLSCFDEETRTRARPARLRVFEAANILRIMRGPLIAAMEDNDYYKNL